MKTLVVYFSLEGNTEYVANKIITPPIRTFVEDNKSELSSKKLAVYACQSGAGADKAFVKLAKTIGIEDFEHTAIFIDPKAKKNEGTDAQIDSFCDAL